MTQEFPQSKELEGDFGTEQSIAAEAMPEESCKGVFPSDYHVEQAVDTQSAIRFLIFCAETNLTWRVGATELTVAKLFDGLRTYDEIATVLRTDHKVNISTEKLKAFEERLIKFRLLRTHADERPLVHPL